MPLRTVVYVDGFNLYFGCLKRAPHCRWLDVAALASHLCTENNPDAEVIAIKYFTARIKQRLSPRGPESRKAQDDYLLALKTHAPQIQIIEGKYFIVPGSYYANTSPVDFSKKYRVLRPEEKHTDVNIALHMLSDATDGICDQQVLFSNDSDCAPILKMIRERHNKMMLGVIPPILSTETDRHPSRELTEFAHWTRRPISEQDLLHNQLPNPVRTRKRSIARPAHWVASPPSGT